MKKTKIVAAACSLVLLLSGCGQKGDIYSNYLETEHLLLVQTLGFDGGQGALTVSASSGKPVGGSVPLIISHSGVTISSAMKLMQDFASNEQLYFAHTQYIIIGEDTAKEGIEAILDYVERNTQIRISTSVFIARGCTAKELITGPDDAEFDITEALASIHRDTDARGYSHVSTCLDTARSLAENGVALISAVSVGNTGETIFMKEDGTTALPEGYAIIKDGKLIGYLDGNAAIATSLLTDHLGTASIPLHDGKGGTFSLDFDSSRAEIKPHWAGNKLESIEINAFVGAGIGELDSEIKDITNEKTLETLNKMLSEQIEKSIYTVLEKAQDMGADFLDMGEALRRDNQSAYNALPEDWLRTAKFNVQVTAEIEHSYELGSPISIDGGEGK